MGSCWDPWRHESEGRDAARWGERHDSEHRERMDNARWDSDSCDASYARGYERELRYQEERREEERAEQRAAERRAEARAYEEQMEYDRYMAYQQEPEYPQEPTDHA